MKSAITIAASSICKHKITDRLNKIQQRTVGCSIFYFWGKQTMDIFFYCTFTWICVDFSCKTVFISYRVMSAKPRVLKCCCLLFAWTEFWESAALCCVDGKMQICYPTCSHTLPGQRRVWLHTCYRFANRHQIHRHHIAGSKINFLIQATTGDQWRINFKE